MKTIVILAILIASVLVAGCTQYSSTNPTPTPTGSSNTVSIKGFAFNPSTLTVPVGTTVTWTNDDSTIHTVTSDSGSELGSGQIPVGQTYSHTFNSAGTFSYHCSIHTSMKAQVVVE
jgi:plastocyanin